MTYILGLIAFYLALALNDPLCFGFVLIGLAVSGIVSLL